MQTSATIAASGIKRSSSWSATSGNCSLGTTCGNAASIATPWEGRRKNAAAMAAPPSAISPPGMRGFRRSHSHMTASTATPTASAPALACGASRSALNKRTGSGPSTGAMPSSSGNCPTTMCTAMPAKNPVMTGIDSRSAIQPARRMPAAISSTPLNSATSATNCGYCADPLATSAAILPAKIGATVESAPTDT